MNDVPADQFSVHKTIAGFVAFLLSQIPSLDAIFKSGIVPFSIYQPLIYDGRQLFLIIPAAVALGSILWIETSRRAFLSIFVIFMILGISVLAIWNYFPPQSPIHFYNWILWYCLIALFLALLLRVYLHFVRLAP
jgi:hypothetical protein